SGRLKAILPVHVFGQPMELNAIIDAARTHGVAVVEDACEAIGAALDGVPAGRLGDAGVFGFYPNKQMTTGEGGIVLTDREDWYLLLRSLRNHGRDDFGERYVHQRLGYNYRLDEMSAALGVAQLARLDELLRKRQAVAARYIARLQEIDGV